MLVTKEKQTANLFFIFLVAASAVPVFLAGKSVSFIFDLQFPALIVASLLAGLAWVLLSAVKPLLAFTIMLFLLSLAYTRFAFNFFALEGGVNRGFISVVDFLWFGFLIALLPAVLQVGKFMLSRLSIISFFILLYLGFSILLPLIGPLAGHPLSFITSAMRLLQWASFALFAYLLVRRYGFDRVFFNFVKVLLIASILHFVYAVVQYGAAVGALPSYFLALDQSFAASREVSWFFYPRTTGLFVNPNSYGVFSALTAVIAVALISVGVNKHFRVLSYVGFISSIMGVLLSGSRSGLLALLVAGLVILLITSLRSRIVMRYIGSYFVVGAGGVWVALVLMLTMPAMHVLLDRFYNFFMIGLIGAEADPDAIARVEMWQYVWHNFINYYPLGTWAPPSYVMHLAIDSYYFDTLGQGTPLFTFTFVLFLVSVAWLGVKLFNAKYKQGQALGIIVLGFSAVFAAASIPLSPILEPFLAIQFWVVIGLGFAKYRIVQGKKL